MVEMATLNLLLVPLALLEREGFGGVLMLGTRD